ncbi:MAG: RICIN domain-containing protein [Acidobacteriaceae bacterium]|nr:RICIN domain-containing protein [Acidobacteriaceae bacterium]
MCLCLASLAAAQSFSPARLTFGSQTVGTTGAPLSVTFTNSTGQPWVILNGISASGDFHIPHMPASTCGFEIAPGVSCSISVTFAPVGIGSRTGTLEISGSSIGSYVSVQLNGTGMPPQIFASSALDFGSQSAEVANTKTISVTNSTPWILYGVQFGLSGENSDDFALTTTCGTILDAGARCSLSIAFQPSAYGQRTALVTFSSSNVSGATGTLSLTGTAAFDFGEEKVTGRSLVQTISYTNTAGAPGSVSAAITGTNSGDFVQANNCGTSLAAGASCSINLVFSPMLSGNRSAVLSISNSADGSQEEIPLIGTGVLNGVFEIVNELTGKVVQVAGGSDANGAAIEQSALNGQPNQQWQFVAAGANYSIANVANGKVLDVTNFSTEDGAHVQQFQYLAGANQKWQLEPVDDVHYKIVNLLSGKLLDVTDGSSADGVPIEQWEDVGNPRQLWVLVQAGSYNIGNVYSKKMLDVTNGSLADGTLIQQWTANASAEQEWQLIATGGCYYSILNVTTGKVLDVIGGSATGGAKVQEWEYLAGENQQWQLVPHYKPGGLNYEIRNRLSGKILDDTNWSTSNGTSIQQWDYVGGDNQLWQISPIVAYKIVNRYSGLVLDVIDGFTTDGTQIQQWSSVNDDQQQWQLLDTGDGYYALLNKLTGKSLDVTGGYAANGTLLQQWDYLGNANQQWQLVSTGDGYYAIVNRQTGKALDDTNWSISGGTLIQLWEYLGKPNQQWQLAPAFN